MSKASLGTYFLFVLLHCQVRQRCSHGEASGSCLAPIFMKSIICKVISQSEKVYVTSKKSENGQLAKCYLRLRELGGDYEDEYQCALLGDIALKKYEVGKVIVASLRFTTHESNGAYYQDIVVTEIVELNN